MYELTNTHSKTWLFFCSLSYKSHAYIYVYQIKPKVICAYFNLKSSSNTSDCRSLLKIFFIINNYARYMIEDYSKLMPANVTCLRSYDDDYCSGTFIR